MLPAIHRQHTPSAANFLFILFRALARRYLPPNGGFAQSLAFMDSSMSILRIERRITRLISSVNNTAMASANR